MARLHRFPALPPALLLALLGSLAPGCAPELPADGSAADTAAGPACQGDDPANFCDDCNPCTDKANCTPCSALPASERDIYHCTADDELPAFCAGRTGCVHVPFSTPAGQRESCFPVADAAGAVDTAGAHAGVCHVGRCVDEE